MTGSLFLRILPRVEQKLLSTAEMLSIIRSAEGDRLPLGQAGDVRSMVSGNKDTGTFPAADELPVLRSTLQAIGEIDAFFVNARTEGLYPRLDRVVDGLVSFPAPLAVIDRVLDRFGNIKGFSFCRTCGDQKVACRGCRKHCSCHA